MRVPYSDHQPIGSTNTPFFTHIKRGWTICLAQAAKPSCEPAKDANELQHHSHSPISGSWLDETEMYVCNCNGIRERDVYKAIEAGADRPSEVFRHCKAAPQCAKCICDVRRMIQDSHEALRHAAQ